MTTVGAGGTAAASDGAERIAVVLPAGGCGLRAATPTPKQFWPIDSRPLVYYTLATLEGIAWINDVVVPIEPAYIERMTTSATAWGFVKTRFVAGGSTRHRSIRCGVQALKPDCTTVIVHDAVRPFVDAATLRAVSEAARDHGAAGTTVPLVSTVIKVDPEGFLERSLDRSEYTASQTPQAFRRDVITRAYDCCTAHDLDHGTECLHLAQTYGGSRVKLVEGIASNLWKVTHQHDLFAAEQMVKKKLRQVALVTGGTRGIGKATVIALANRGFKVAVLARTADDVTALTDKIGGMAVVADVTNPQQVKRAFASVVERFGRLDVCVNNAGQIIAPTMVADTDDAGIAQMMDCNLGGTFYCCREAFRQMRLNQPSGGVIVNVGSSSVDGGRVGQGAYSMSKAGVHNLTETLALEGRTAGILAYCIAPARTVTDLRKEVAPDEDGSGCLQPSDVADAIASVVMDANPHLTGQSFWLRYPKPP